MKTMMKHTGAGIAAACCALAGACAGPDGGPAAHAAAPAAATAAAPGAQAPGRADRVAEALVLAAEAERTQDGAALARAAQRLERLGASPQSEADAAAMTRWRASLPADAPPLRGRALGPAYRSGALGPGAATQLHQTFLGGRSAQIVVRVSRGPAPRLVVRDQSDREVCEVAGDPIKCRWVPLYTQRHLIEILNDGPEKSEFYIVFD